MQETQVMQVRSPGQEDPLEEEMATHSSILAWNIPWTEEPGGLQFTGLQRFTRNWVTKSPPPLPVGKEVYQTFGWYSVTDLEATLISGDP